ESRRRKTVCCRRAPPWDICRAAARACPPGAPQARRTSRRCPRRPRLRHKPPCFSSSLISSIGAPLPVIVGSTLPALSDRDQRKYFRDCRGFFKMPRPIEEFSTARLAQQRRRQPKEFGFDFRVGETVLRMSLRVGHVHLMSFP